MEGGLLNGKAFRYVHHYMNEQVFGCRGGGGGGGVKYCTRMPYKRVGLWPWMAYPTADRYLQETGEKLLDINRQVKRQVDTE